MPVKFLNEKGYINEKLLDEDALKIAQSFFKIDKRKNKKISVSSSQLRRFYHDIKDLEKKFDITKNWDQIFPLVKMVKAKISYATSDSKIKPFEQDIYNNFKRFITDCIDSIHTGDDFKAFCKHFEAVVGYYYGEGGR